MADMPTQWCGGIYLKKPTKKDEKVKEIDEGGENLPSENSQSL